MATNLSGLNFIPQSATLTTGGGAPLGLNNEIRGGVHRVSGNTGDTHLTIDGRYLQAGMLVFDESTSTLYQYINFGPAEDPATDPNDPWRRADGTVPNTTDNWVVFEAGGGTGQLGYSIEQIGTIAADTTELANTYRWHTTANATNFSGLNGFGYLSPATATLTDAAATPEQIFNVSGEFINSTGEERIIRSFDIDMDVLTLGIGDDMRIDPVVIHAVSNDATASPPTYSDYNAIRVDAQLNSLFGVRTFRFDLGSDITLAPGDAISLTLTDLVSNQSADITGVRWSSTTDSWLNPVYPLITRSRETVDTWHRDIDYDLGDQVTFAVAAGDIEAGSGSEPNVPLTNTVLHFQFIGGTPSGSTPTDPPLVRTQVVGGIGIASRQWAVAAGTTSPWFPTERVSQVGILQYAVGAYVTYNGHLYRALQPITRGPLETDTVRHQPAKLFQ